MSDKNPSLYFRLLFPVTYFTGTLLPQILIQTHYWSHITKNLILGAIPIETKVFSFGGHREAIMADCEQRNAPLGGVFSIVNAFELKGKGLGFLSPVQNWNQEEYTHGPVQHELIEMDDFGGNIDVEDIKKAVDQMHDLIKADKSVYVHCKAGKGRSFSFVCCYLMLHHHLSIEDAISLIRKKRPQVSPSMAQFRTIERFRAAYCPESPKLNVYSKAFQSYRKDWSRHLDNKYARTLLTAAPLFGLASAFLYAGASPAVWARLVSGIPLPTVLSATAGIISLIVSAVIQLERYFEQERFEIDYESYRKDVSSMEQRIHGSDAADMLSTNLLACKDTIQNLKDGIDSATSWTAWGKSWLKGYNRLDLNQFNTGMKMALTDAPECEVVTKLSQELGEAKRKAKLYTI